MKRILSLVLVMTAVSVFADPTRPVCDPHEEDATLLQNKKARDFFSDRAANADCVQKYQAAKKQFDDARGLLVKQVSDKVDAATIDKQEALVDNLRAPYLNLMAECGPCAANPIAAPIEVPANGRTEIWYTSDGSCQLPTTDKATLAKAFDNLTNDLTHLHAYPRQPGVQKGYNSILDVAAYDPKTGALDHNLDGFDGNGSSLFISVMGPIGTAFSYYFQDKFKFSEQNGLRQFAMAGTAVPPEGFTPPRSISYVTASGKKKVSLNTMLFPGSQTTWYVNEDGYVRYCATADFGIKSAFVQQYGRTLMLDLLNSSLEKTQQLK